MRKVIIDFTAEEMLPDGACLGKKGEHNATELIITPPAELAENDNVAGYIIAFQIGAHKIFRSELIEKVSPISYKLPVETTQANIVSLQLEGYDANESLIIKSNMVDGLHFEPSVCGEETAGISEKNLVAEIAANTLARHSHTNKSTLDKFGETDGALTFDGKAVDSKLTIKSVFCDNAWEHGAIMTDSTKDSNIDFYVFDNAETFLTDENGAKIDFSTVVVIDVAIIYNNTEYHLSQLAHSGVLLVNSDSIPVVFSRPAEDSSISALNVARIIGATEGDFYSDTAAAEGFKIYYYS